ncbi:MAG: hypothetical protein H8E44_36540 [Planctomycetes bacterium]|nr:hypothetical protein [Planctomycetota bacterium]
MDMKTNLGAILLASLCVPASAVGIVLGFIIGCVIAMVLQGIFAPGEAYDYYSVGTPVGNVAILGPVAIGAAVPWIVFGLYVRRAFRGGRQRKVEKALVSGREQGIEEQQSEAEVPGT